MALISPSFVISILTYHLLNKIHVYDYAASWMIFQRLLFYLPPTTEALRAASGISTNKGRASGRGKHRRGQTDFQDRDSFQVSKDIDIDLQRTYLDIEVISALKYYAELRWILNVGLTSVIAYLLTEFYYSFKDWIIGAAANTARQTETNFSLLWCIVTTFLCILILGRLVHLYYGATERGEFFLVLLVGGLGAVISVVMLAFNRGTLEFGLRDAHKNFTEKLNRIQLMGEFARTVNFSYFGFGLLVGLLSGVASALVAFPGIRFGKMYRDAKEQAVAERNPAHVMLYSISFALPAALCLLWMPAVQEHLWMENKYMSFEMFRTILLLLGIVVRFLTMNGFLQAHLDSPRKRMHALHQEPGRIEAEKLQFLLAAPSRYIGVAAVQYVAPLVILTMLSFLYLSADMESFFPVKGDWTYNRVFGWLGLPADYTATVYEIHNAVWSLFTGALLKALFGYLIWWILISHFCFSLFAYYILQDQQ